MQKKEDFIRRIQLSDTIFVDIGVGDLFIYSEHKDIEHINIKEAEKDYLPSVDANCVEIISFYSKRHFRFHRDGAAYWWSEIQY